MVRAIWNGRVVAESDQTVVVEGNHYFPRDSIHEEFFDASPKRTHCGWKGEASYFTLRVDGAENVDAAWTYETPLDAASHIRGHVAFWKGVRVEA